MAESGWEAKREWMVSAQLRRRGIHDERVLAAMGTIPREIFVPEPYRERSYEDEPLCIGSNQTISQPYMIARMVQELALEGTETVLEVGAGCGYHAAVLASVAAHVITVELVSELAAAARRNLEATGFRGRVEVVTGDGSLGLPERAPFGAISVAAAAPAVPAALLDQLADGGRMVIPVGSLDEQELLVVTKSGGRTQSRVAAHCRFVPLRGGEGWKID